MAHPPLDTGKAFAFGSPSPDTVLGCGGDGPDQEALRRVSDVEKKVREVQMQTGKRFWFEVDPAALGEEELPVFITALQRIRDNVRRRIDKLQSTPPPQQ